MSATSYLSNCYIPSVLPQEPNKTLTSKEVKEGESPERKIIQQKFQNRYLDDDNQNASTTNNNHKTKRSTKELRRICIDRNILSKSSGSALVEIGHTKVLCSVHGPRSSSSSFGRQQNKEFHSDGSIHVDVRYAPYSNHVTNDNIFNSTSTPVSNKEVELSERVRDVILSSIPLEKLSKCVVDLYIMILQSDGDSSVFSAAITSASIALADAGIEVSDLVSSCSVAVVKGPSTTAQKDGEYYMYLLDPTKEEQESSTGNNRDTAIVTLAMLCNWKEVVFLDQTGHQLPSTVTLKAMELCRDGCMVMSTFMRECLLKHL